MALDSKQIDSLLDQEIEKLEAHNAALDADLRRRGIVKPKPAAPRAAKPAAKPPKRRGEPGDRQSRIIHADGHVEILDYNRRDSWSAEAKRIVDAFDMIDKQRTNSRLGYLISSPTDGEVTYK